MPLTSIQSDILRLLAAHRDPESYVARSTTVAGAIDIFQDREQRVTQAAKADAAVLEQHGYTLD